MADHWAHWLAVGAGLEHPPAVFQVNWFRKGSDGSFLWPGFGENSRVLAWILDRVDGSAGGVDSPLGVIPARADLDTSGLGLSDENWRELFEIDPDVWGREADGVASFFASFAGRVPAALEEELGGLRSRLA
jgi:phosphoenolpyruvate carboxykinase (GTP)